MPQRRPHKAKPPRSPRHIGAGTLASPIIGASLIVTIAYGVSLLQAGPEVVAAAAIAYALLEGVVLLFIGRLWSPRGVGMAVAMAVVTALLAIPGRWGLAYLQANRTAPFTDLIEDLAVTCIWAAFCGLAGATVLRDRLSALIPNR